MQYGMNQMEPKAQKRFDNDMVRAKQGTMLSDAARSSFRTKSQPLRTSPQAPQPQPSVQAPTAQAPSAQARSGNFNSFMGGGPSQPVDMGETIKNNIDLERLLSSPNIQQLYTRAKLRKFFKRNDPNSSMTDAGTDAVNDLISNM